MGVQPQINALYNLRNQLEFLMYNHLTQLKNFEMEYDFFVLETKDEGVFFKLAEHSRKILTVNLLQHQIRKIIFR